jgi:diaminopimelate epimerase
MTPTKFEKWQALGNDYLIFEERALPFALTPARIERICDPHTGIGSDGILLLSEPTERGYVARLRIFNPDGSEAELSGNGAREAVMYLRRSGWADADRLSIQTAAGEVRATITGDTCSLDMGRARTSSQDFPSGDADGAGTLEAQGTTWRFQHVQVGNPQCAIHVKEGVEQLDALDLPTIGTAIMEHELFPNRTNVSWFAELEPGVIRARIFERGVGETMSSGTGASGAAIAYVLRGGDSPVTVRLDGGTLQVDVEEDLHYNLSGWAVPVYRGELADDFEHQLESL